MPEAKPAPEADMKQSIEDKFDSLNNGLSAVEGKLTEVNTSLAALQTGQEMIRKTFQAQADSLTHQIQAQADSHTHQVEALDHKVDEKISGLERTLSTHHEEMRQRLAAIEQAVISKP